MMKSHIAKLASAALPVVAVMAMVPAPAAAAATSTATCAGGELLGVTAVTTGTLALTVSGKVYEITGKLRDDSNGDGVLCLRLHGNGHIKVSDD
jgi:hypothetical protein